MVERFHRQLKSGIRASENTDWTVALPIVLLGIRSTVKEDIGLSPSEMVYRYSQQTVRLPGDMFDANNKPIDNARNFADALANFVNGLAATSPKTQKGPTFVPQELSSCSHVYVRVDKVKTGLVAPYEGPYRVLDRNDKNMTLLVQGKNEKNLTRLTASSRLS
jgi:hypothetical protein